MTMNYSRWSRVFSRKHAAILATLEGLSVEEVVDYFTYDNMRLNHPEFCPLYAQGRRCHELRELNCYLCACPHFRYCDTGIERIGRRIRYSYCAVDAPGAAEFWTETAIHQDCSGCLLPHHRGFILGHFDRDWKRIMSRCQECRHGRNGATD